MKLLSVTAQVVVIALLVLITAASAGATVKIGLNYPKTGPYSAQGLEQWRAAALAVEEINAAGGILDRHVEIVWRDTQSRPDVAASNVTEMIDTEGVSMVFGGASSAVAITTGKICQEKGVPFFGTLTYSTDTTGKDGRRHIFRECYNSWMAAKAIASYLKEQYPGKKYMYVTADYTWGHTTEASVRKFTGTTDESVHKRVLTPFPGAAEEDFKKALSRVRSVKPDVLVLVLFGNDMVKGIRQATAMGLKSRCAIVVPNLTLGMADGAGPKIMEGIVGALPWCWQVPYKYNYERGKEFVEKYSMKYNRYPSTSGASAYTILYEYKAAVEAAGSFESSAVITALEGREYQILKDKQRWRRFDHQSIQTVYAVKCKPSTEVLKDKFKLDYFDIIHVLPAEEAARTHAEWVAARKAAGKPARLEDF